MGVINTLEVFELRMHPHTKLVGLLMLLYGETLAKPLSGLYDWEYDEAVSDLETYCVDAQTINREKSCLKEIVECKKHFDELLGEDRGNPRARDVCVCKKTANNRVKTQGSHTQREWVAMIALCNYKCACCRQPKELTKDHVVPKVFGGCDDIDNIQPLCLSCNTSKWTETRDYRPSDWRERLDQALNKSVPA